MNVSLYQAAAALDGNIRWQQMISENLAAGSVPGFKKKDISFSTIQAGILGSGTDSLVAQNHKSLLPSPAIGTNFAPGNLRATNVKSDVAIEGPGFLSVRLPDGQTAYTRDGEFRVSLQGQLLNKDGYELLGEGGVPIQVEPGRGELIEISEAGDVSQGLVIRGKLALFEFPDNAQLKRVGSGYYLASPEVQPAAATRSTFAQGFLESSNLEPMSEVSSLMLALRHFEANQKVIHMQDERMGRLIQELSATS